MKTTENPLGIIRIDHLEFTTSSPGTLISLFHALGMKKTAEKHTPALSQSLMQTGKISFLISQPSGADYNRQYLDRHDGGVSAIAFLVEDAEAALAEALRRGAEQRIPLEIVQQGTGIYKRTGIQGFGDVLNLFIERTGFPAFSPGFSSVDDPGSLPDDRNPGLIHLDHLTNNVPFGEMQKWVDFYHRIYGFEAVRYFEIKGEKTALRSKVVRSANKQVTIPINEPWGPDGDDQISEFIRRHRGSGVQHIALSCRDILKTVKKLRSAGFEFLTPPPHSYYEMVPERVPAVSENLAELEAESILVDGDETGYLLQIFTKDQIGPSFFEMIERKGHDGFGDGNFQALFDAIERDQMQRGVLK
ncbi:MAG: 4-hydroxyphenylpyruvate dioxygenase [Bacteroidetes bacterium]|nr:4-hydroxyphenylpyruvate dioxygenase [Bacteroidota bacterium]